MSKHSLSPRFAAWFFMLCLCGLLTGCQSGDGALPQQATPSPSPVVAALATLVTAVLPTPTAAPTLTATTTVAPPTSTALATAIFTNTPAPSPTAFVQSTYGITIPEGISIEIFADNLNYPTSLAFDEDGALYVGINNAIYPTQPIGEIYRLVDSDHDGVAETRTRFAADVDRAIGLLYNDGELYVSQRGSIRALSDSDGDGVADRTRSVVEDLPAFGLHQNNSLALGDDGYLYFTLGSSTNNGPETDPLNGTIMRVLPQGGEVEIIASGFRNPFDLAFDAEGSLFATDNGCDPPACVDAPEELNHIFQGERYGFPDFVGAPPPSSDTIAPIATFTPHSSANGIVVYGGEMFPEWRGDAFVALFGSYLGGFGDVGLRVLRVEFSGGGDGIDATVHPFAHGFSRPLDIAVAADGALYIADFEVGRVYRMYR